MPPARSSPHRPSTDPPILDLVERNPGQCTVEEYTKSWNTIVELAPCNVLVFGVGWDTPMWLDANRDGRTVFLESNTKWIAQIRSEAPAAEILPVRYTTRRFLWRWLMRRPSRLMLDLPAEVKDTEWDVILVDAPKGTSWRSPGRMQSIYTASVLASGWCGETHVLVHDCHRAVEAAYSDEYLGDELADTVHHLRHYRL